MTRRYPRGGLSPKAAEMGMASLAEAYSDPRTPIDRTTDISNLIDLAQYIAETYADLDQGDTRQAHPRPGLSRHREVRGRDQVV